MKTRRDQITKIGRLLKRSDFLRVQGAGKKWVTPPFKAFSYSYGITSLHFSESLT